MKDTNMMENTDFIEGRHVNVSAEEVTTISERDKADLEH